MLCDFQAFLPQLFGPSSRSNIKQGNGMVPVWFQQALAPGDPYIDN
jgi:hypothetical protein